MGFGTRDHTCRLHPLRRGLRAGLRAFLAAMVGAACLTTPAWAGDGDSRSHNIFDDDFPSSPAPQHSTPAPASTSHHNTDVPDRPVATPPALPPGGTTTTDQPEATGPDAVLPGLVAQLFDGPDQGVLKESRITRRVRATLDAPPDAGPGVATVSFRWTGLLRVPAGGMTINTYVRTGGASRVTVDGKVVSQGAAGTNSSSGHAAKLTEGLHPLVIDVTQIHTRGNGAKEQIWLYWAPEGEEMQPVPSMVLCHYKKDEPAGTLSAQQQTTLRPPQVAPGESSPSPTRVGVQPAATAPPAVAPKGEVPAPTEAELADLRKAVKAKFASYYTDPAPIVRMSLVRKLTDTAATATDTKERYALLREAADLAAGAGDLKTALAIDDTIAGTFKVEASELKLAVLTAAAKTAGKNPAVSRDVGASAMDLSDKANEAGEFDIAMKAAMLAESSLTAARDEGAARARVRVKDLKDLAAQTAHIAPLLKKLAENPDDPDTNTKVGRFYCFTAGRWDKGLPLLARGNDVGLKALAESELSKPTEIADRLKLGDGWWDKAAGETSTAAAKCKDHATHWYMLVRASSKEELPDRVLQRLATLSRALDLTALVDVGDGSGAGAANADPLNADPNNVNGGVRRVNRTVGLWRREKGNLLSPTDGFMSQLTVPYQPVGDYDYIVEFTPLRANAGVTLCMPVRGSFLNFMVTNSYANFEPLSLRPGSFGPILKGRVAIVQGHRYQAMVQFRRNGVRGSVNNVVLREWATDYSELGRGGFVGSSRDTDPRSLGLRANEEVIVHSIRVVEVPRGGAK